MTETLTTEQVEAIVAAEIEWLEPRFSAVLSIATELLALRDQNARLAAESDSKSRDWFRFCEDIGVNADTHEAVADAVNRRSIDSELLALRKRVEWQDISTAPKNRKVLAAYKNPLGNWRVVTACYHTELPWYDDQDPPDNAGEYAPTGWYEESDSHETILPTAEVPMLWMPLPTPKEPD